MRLLRLCGLLAALVLIVGAVEAMPLTPMSKLLRAAANGDLETVTQLVDDKFYPPSFDKNYAPVNGYGFRPGFSAFQKGDWATPRRVTALYEASLNGHIKVVEFLLGKGADVNAVIKDFYGDNDYPLMAAVRNGHVDVVACLVSVPGIGIDQKSGFGSNEYTALKLAENLSKHPHGGQPPEKTEDYREIVKLLKNAKASSVFTGQWACVDCGFLNAFDKGWCEAKKCRQFRRHNVVIPLFIAAPSAPASNIVQAEKKGPEQGVSPEDESIRSKLRGVAKSGTALGLEKLLPPELGRDEILRRLHLKDGIGNDALMSAGANVNLEFIKYVWPYLTDQDNNHFLTNAVVKDFSGDSEKENRRQKTIDYLVTERGLSLDKAISLYRRKDRPESEVAIARLEAAKKRLKQQSEAQPQKQKPPAPRRSAPKLEKSKITPKSVELQGAWVCLACTYENGAGNLLCAMCGASKP